MLPAKAKGLYLIALVAFVVTVKASSASANQGQNQAGALNELNNIRRSRGLPPLQYSQAMESAAARHSFDMAKSSSMSHSGSDGSRHVDRLRLAGGGGFACNAENVAMLGSGNSSPSAVFNMWMNSQGHRDNMLNSKYTHAGVAQSSGNGRVYWTLVLGGCNK